MAERCNRDCFNCPYEDCILEESDITLAERVALQEMERDFVLPKSRKEKEIAAYKKAYYEANREEIAARQKAYREANREEIAAYQKAYREANREKIASYQRGKRKKHKQARDAAARMREGILDGGAYAAR